MRVHHIKNYIDDQTAHMEFIASAVANLTSVGASNVSVHRIETRRSALKEEWNKFSLKNDAIQVAMRQLRQREKDYLLGLSYFREKLFKTTQEGYLEALEIMSSMLARVQKDSRSPSIHSTSQGSSFSTTFHPGPRLPNVNLPTFDGSPSEWLQFKDLFDSLVLSNTGLAPVLKLQYLKQSLRGTASQLLKNTTLTSDNFQKAWDSLVSFYENKRLLVNSALQSLTTLKRMTKESAVEMENLYTSVTQIYRSLETLKRPVKTWDDFLVFMTVQKMDPESVKAWELYLGSSQEPPAWQKLIEFLLTRLLTLKAVEKSRKTVIQSTHQTAKVHFSLGKQHADECSICAAEHYTTKCPEYSDKTVENRYAVLKKHNLCFNCLKPHRAADCRSTNRCNKCGKKHHTTIHRSNHRETSTSNSKESESSTSEVNAQVNHASIHHSTSVIQTILATVQLQVISEKGEKIKARALIDPGSQISFISENLVQQLQIARQPSSIPLLGIGAVKAGKTRGLVSITLTPHFHSSTKYKISAYILPKLTARLASVNIEKSKWIHLKSLQLADPRFQSPGAVDIIIGADYYGQILEEGLRRGPPHSPTAQLTIFGWILFGPSTPFRSSSEAQSFHTSIDEDLYELLQRFWKLDELPGTLKISLSVADQECEDHFRSTHSRSSDGRYIVRLPLKKSINELGDSRNLAMRMLSRLTKRMQLNPSIQRAYANFLKEYEDLNHMRLISESSSYQQSPRYYLPHHGVIREHSTTTKLRVVFNASSRSTTGVALNDIVHTGTKLQNELIDVLIWFRQFRYVFTSDIEKMYRQIDVNPLDWDLQRILWNKKQDEILTYQLTTVTYGTACAPFLALRAVQQLIEDEGVRFPLAVPTLSKGRYVDDVFGGADTIEEAQIIVQQVNGLCMAGKFPLQKWATNESIILQNLPVEKQLFPTPVPIDKQATVNTLGMIWNPISDTFYFTWDAPSQSKITKRTTLSAIAKLFDPVGFLAPITISAKLFIQELWSLKLEWDDPLPPHLTDKWSRFLQQLQEIEKLSFPRWFGTTSQSSIEIHGFCDASQHALAAVIYIKSTDPSGKCQISLACSKTKVAPIKRVTIPRLELSSAVLITKLVHHLSQVLNFDKIPLHLWTDSAITFTWINNHPSRWKDFVHN